MDVHQRERVAYEVEAGREFVQGKEAGLQVRDFYVPRGPGKEGGPACRALLALASFMDFGLVGLLRRLLGYGRIRPEDDLQALTRGGPPSEVPLHGNASPGHGSCAKGCLFRSLLNGEVGVPQRPGQGGVFEMLDADAVEQGRCLNVGGG